MRKTGQVIGSVAVFTLVMALILLVLLTMMPLQLLVAAPTNTFNTILATVTVVGQCQPSLSNTLIFFASTQAGFTAVTDNVVSVKDIGLPSNIAVYGTNWFNGGVTFFVTNTLWTTSNTPGAGTPLQINGNVPIDTDIPILTSGGTGNIFFGVSIPAGQSAGTYQQQIFISLSC